MSTALGQVTINCKSLTPNHRCFFSNKTVLFHLHNVLNSCNYRTITRVWHRNHYIENRNHYSNKGWPDFIYVLYSFRVLAIMTLDTFYPL